MDALITLLPGDGIGPEVTKSGQTVLDTIGDMFGHNFSYSEQYIGGSAIDHCHDPQIRLQVATNQMPLYLVQ